MAFNSISFLFVFLPAAWLLTVSMRRDARLVLGIAFGLVFVVWAGSATLCWTLATMVWTALLASAISRVRALFLRRLLLISAVFGLVMALAIAKYLRPELMAVGLSFLVFFAISVLMDIQRNPQLFSLSGLLAYLGFFPKFLTGPLIPFHRFVEQIQPREYDWPLARLGFGRLTLGLFKKLWIADPLGKAADQVFAAGAVSGPAEHWLGLLAFALQIFIDFSAYTDMAIGLGRIFGVELGENFNYPYMARSLRDFWRRWHISLGLWFRDYLFLPLAYGLERRLFGLKLPLGLRSDRLAAGVALWLTMVLCGAWHGQSLNFWIWGFYFGTLMQFESARRVKRGLWALLRTQGLVLLGWVLFRTATPAQSVDFLLGLWPFAALDPFDIRIGMLADGRFIWAAAAGLFFVFPVFAQIWGYFKKRKPGLVRLAERSEIVIWLAAWLLILTALSGASHRPFIYLRF